MRRLDIVLAELHQVRAAGDVFRAGLHAAGERAVQVAGPGESESLHVSGPPGRVTHRVDDVGVGAAPAQIATHVLADLGIRPRVTLLD